MKKILLKILLLYFMPFSIAQDITDIIVPIPLCETTTIISSPPTETEFNNIRTPCSSTPLTNTIDFYLVTIESGTTFTFTISPDSNIDYDFASWLNPDLTNLGTADRGSQNYPIGIEIYEIGLSLDEPEELCEVVGTTGNSGNVPGMVRWYDVQPGDVIVIAVNKWGEGNSGYSITFGGDAVETLCPLEVRRCDDDYNEEEDFDLNEIIIELENIFENHTVTLYDTFENAEGGTGNGTLIGFFTAYLTNNPTIIYARIEDENGNLVKVHEVHFYVNPSPIVGIPFTLFYCTASGSQVGMFNLTLVESEITDETENYLFSYYTTYFGAEEGGLTNLISNSSTYFGSAGIVYVRVENEFGCYVIREIPLEIIQMSLEEQSIELPIICMEEGTTTIDLTVYNEQLTDEGYLSYQYEYYLNESDAQTGNTINAISNPEEFPITANNTYTIYIRIIVGINCSPIVSSLSFDINYIPELQIEEIGTICSGEAITLNLSTTGETINWYDDEFSTIPFHTGITYTTPPLNESTIYYVEATNGECTSERMEITIIVHELPEIEAENPAPICIGNSVELSVLTNGEIVNWYDSEGGTMPIFTGNPFTTPLLTETTSYWVEAVSLEGCFSERMEVIVTVTEEIIPEFELIEPICYGEDFTLPTESENGITGTWSPEIDNTQTTTYTFTPDDGQCATEFEMTVEVIEIPELTLPEALEVCYGESITITLSTTGETVNWYEDEFSVVPFHVGTNYTTPPLNESTTYYVETTNGECISERMEITIIVNELPTIEAENPDPICVGNSVELSVLTNGEIVNWYNSETAVTPTFTGNPFTTPLLTETTSYWVEAVSLEGCFSERMEIIVEITDEITPVFTIQAQYCLDSEPEILPTTSNNGISGNWSPSIIDTSTIGTQIYTFTPEVECAEEITVTIEITEIIYPEFHNLPETYCFGSDAIPLPSVSDNGISGTWFPNAINTNIQGMSTYIFSPNGNQCSENFELNIMVYPHPEMDLEENIVICAGDSYTYFAPDGFDFYLWTDSNNQILSETQEVTFTQQGTYTLTVEINGIPCQLSRNIEVGFSQTPVITEIKSTENSLTVYATGVGPFEYSLDEIFWQSSNVFYNLEPGIYFVYARDLKGCGSSAKQGAILGIPNFISPNGDGLNDTWKMRALSAFPNTRLQIFDRYGKIFVDRLMNNDFEWNGHYNSRPLPSGTYWYILIFEDGEKLSGSINVRNH